MTTSGSYDYGRTRDQLIQAALRKCGVFGRGKTLSAEDTNDAAEALELMIKAYQAEGLQLWKQREATLFTVLATQSYSLGPTGDHCTDSYVSTTTSAAAASGASAIVVTSATDLAVADNITIKLDDGTYQWTTIASIVTTTINLDTTLTDDVASGNTVRAYTSKIPRPLKVLSARRVVGTNETPVDIITRDEYFTLPVKSSTGYVNEVYYSPQLTNGVFYVWPTGNADGDLINLTLQYPIEDFDAAGNDPDFPQEALEMLIFGLASRIGPEYGLKLDRQMYLDAMAEKKKQEYIGWDQEEGSVIISYEN